MDRADESSDHFHQIILVMLLACLPLSCQFIILGRTKCITCYQAILLKLCVRFLFHSQRKKRCVCTITKQGTSSREKKKLFYLFFLTQTKEKYSCKETALLSCSTTESSFLTVKLSLSPCTHRAAREKLSAEIWRDLIDRSTCSTQDKRRHLPVRYRNRLNCEQKANTHT